MREFTVKKGVMGYVVQIGCQQAGFSTKEDLVEAIAHYINDPEGMEKKHYSHSTPESLSMAAGAGNVGIGPGVMSFSQPRNSLESTPVTSGQIRRG